MFETNLFKLHIFLAVLGDSELGGRRLYEEDADFCIEILSFECVFQYCALQQSVLPCSAVQQLSVTCGESRMS